MYVGADQFIEAPESFVGGTTPAISSMIQRYPSDPRLDALANYVRVSPLSARTDYVGARSFIPAFPVGTSPPSTQASATAAGKAKDEAAAKAAEAKTKQALSSGSNQ